MGILPKRVYDSKSAINTINMLKLLQYKQTLHIRKNNTMESTRKTTKRI